MALDHDPQGTAILCKHYNIIIVHPPGQGLVRSCHVRSVCGVKTDFEPVTHMYTHSRPRAHHRLSSVRIYTSK